MACDFHALRLLLFDVDGVLTDGSILLHGDGTESKQFNIRDGAAMVWAQRAGLQVGILSARTATATTTRAAQLGLSLVIQGATDKLASYEQILSDGQLQDEHVAYMGDDLQDLAVLRRAGLSAAPCDAAHEVKAAVGWTSRAAGGHGAVREFIEHVLRQRGAWDQIVAAVAGQ